jgi:hypothetical protein
MIVMKVIKPQRLKPQEMRLAMLNAVTKAGRDIQKDFKKTTETWEHKVKFEILISMGEGKLTVFVGTDDKIYRWVDEGTKGPYPIWAGFWTGKSDKKVLAFPSEFEPKTTPRVIDSGPGFSGGDMVLTPYVEHPGIEAREFDETMEKDWEAPFKRRMEAAMREAARKSGHGR